ncbi:hypothetical protein Tco_0658687 [Tanacetum coccineum]
MMETLPSLVKEKVMEQVKKELYAKVRDQVPLGRMQAQISSQIQNAIDNAIPSLVDASVRHNPASHAVSPPLSLQAHLIVYGTKFNHLCSRTQHQLYLALEG